jgi:hypothetical protein
MTPDIHMVFIKTYQGMGHGSSEALSSIPSFKEKKKKRRRKKAQNHRVRTFLYV